MIPIPNRGNMLSANGVDLTATGKWWWDENTDSPGDSELVKWNFSVPLRHGEVFVPNPPRTPLTFTIGMVVVGSTSAATEANFRELRRVLSRQDKLVELRRRLGPGPTLYAQAHRTGEVRAEWVGKKMIRAQFNMSIPAGAWNEDVWRTVTVPRGAGRTIAELQGGVGDATDIQVTFNGNGDDTRVKLIDDTTGSHVEYAGPLPVGQTAVFRQPPDGKWWVSIGGVDWTSRGYVSPGGLRLSSLGRVSVEAAGGSGQTVDIMFRRAM